MTSIIYEETFFFSVDRQANYLFNDNILSLLCKQVLFMCIPPPQKGIRDFVAYFYRLIIHNKQLIAVRSLGAFHSVVEEGIS